MALFRAFSTRRSHKGGGGGYDKLLDETVGTSDDLSYADHHHHHHHHHHHQHHHHQQHHHHHGAGLKRVTSVPASMLFGSSWKKPGYETGFPETKTNNGNNNNNNNNNNKTKQAKGKKDSGKNSHPVFSLFEGKWKKKKITANPDFSRYIEYLKEGGMLNKTTTTTNTNTTTTTTTTN